MSRSFGWAIRGFARGITRVAEAELPLFGLAAFPVKSPNDERIPEVTRDTTLKK
jgi:hypothetical protein